MKFHRYPNRKEPWDPQFFDIYISFYPLSQISDTTFLFYMSLSYYAFLSISGLQNLTTNDIVLDTENKRLKIIIRCSKTDPFGKGETTYVYDNEKNYSPYKLYNLLLHNFENDNLIVDRSGSVLRHHFKVVLKKIGADPKQYSWHSFRRGGAHQAAINGVSDSEIKKYGRWLSDAYVRYTVMKSEFAGFNISNKI